MRALTIFLIIVSCFSHAAAQNSIVIRILVPVFESRTEVEAEPGTIGKRATLILGLQLWRTLIVPKNYTRENNSGIVQWDF